jgi:micrococcal nuclease
MYTYNATVVKIVDGDSVWLEVDVGFHMSYKYNFRLGRINTPELRSKDPEEKAAAYAAKDRLAELIPVGTKVLLKTDKPGKYGRWIAEIFVDLVNVNDTMMDEGLAEPY